MSYPSDERYALVVFRENAQLPNLPKPEPAFPIDKDAWRKLRWSEREMAYQLLVHTMALKAMDVRAAVGRLQREKGKQLLDRTWAEALEALREKLSQELEKAEEFFSGLPDKPALRDNDRREAVVLRDLTIDGYQSLLSRTEEEYQRWLEESQRWLKEGKYRQPYIDEVRGYWPKWIIMGVVTTQRGPQQAKKLKTRLGRDPEVAGLRGRLQIPDDGFPGAGEAARWLHDRWPRDKKSPADGAKRKIFFRGPRITSGTIEEPLIMHVPVLAEATRRLCEKYELDPEWNFFLCFYLLHGKLEPPPRKRPLQPRKKAIAERDAYLLDLWERHSPRHTEIIYKSGLSEEEFLQMKRAHPDASDAKLEVLCYEIGAEKGSLRKDDITYDHLRKIKQRWGDKLWLVCDAD